MNSSHRMFLQAFMCRGIVDAKDVKQLFKLVLERYDKPVPQTEDEKKRNLAAFVMTINSAIKPFNMEIKKGVGEDSGANYYALVNLQDDALTKMASDYTHLELDLFKKMLGGIVASDTGTIGSMDTLNLTHELSKKMTKDAAEEMLFRMKRDKWITETDGKYSLDTRAILELEQYIIEKYPDLATKCSLCKKLCLQGQSCEQCDTKLHRACAAKFFSRQNYARCPGTNCNATWEDYCTQDSVQTQPTQVPSQTNSSARESRKRKARFH